MAMHISSSNVELIQLKIAFTYMAVSTFLRFNSMQQRLCNNM